ELVAQLRQSDALEAPTKWCVERGIGAYIEGKGLIVHRALIARLPPQLQVAIWAASLLADGIDACDLVRIHEGLEHISFYRYDGFETDPLPKLTNKCRVSIRRHKANDHYVSDDNVVLVGKSRFINEEMHFFAGAEEFDRNLGRIAEF